MEMKLTYIAIHTAKPERMKDFYVKYLGAVADEPRLSPGICGLFPVE